MSLAEALLADLDGLSDDGESPEAEIARPTAGSSKGSMLPPPLPAKALNGRSSTVSNGGINANGKWLAEEDEAMDGEEAGMTLEDGSSAVGFVPEGGIRPADELDAEDVEKEDMTGVGDVGKVAKLLYGRRLKEVLEVSRLRFHGFATQTPPVPCNVMDADGFAQGIEKYTGAPSDMSLTGGPLEENPEYHLVVTANNMSVEVDNEILLVHKFVRDHYAPRFPELEQLIAEPWTYLAAVKAIGNAEELTKVAMPSTLPPATILSITLTATSTRGRVLTPAEWKTVERAVEVAEELRRARETIFAYVESRMAAVAPNLSAIVGIGIAAKLLGLAGGLQAFSRTPSCNVMLFGALKKTLASTHLSAASQQRHTGFIFQSQIVQSAQPEDRRRAQRAVSAKCMLAARIDAGKGARDGSYGKKCLAELQKRIEKMAEPPPNKIAKALPIPQETNRKKRGGKR
jgi:U4/U6 small nuclear ribonucleoprotein PRP31